VATTKKTAPKKSPNKKTPARGGMKSGAAPVKRHGPRADLGAPVDGFFAKQPPPLRPIVEKLRTLVEKNAPGATSSLKWGMPFYAIGDNVVCAIAAHKSHVNLILPGPPGTYSDPDGLLTGEGKTGRHLKVRSLSELPEAAVKGWLKKAASLAKA
jgi:hypothetical protein